MKEMCISQAEETANSMIESKNYEQAIELFLNKKMSRNKLLSSWFPIDLDIYNNDLV